MKKVRQMPTEGYYVYNNNFDFRKGEVDIIYTTGVAGKGGHMYYRIMDGHNPKDSEWAILTWTCVPGIQKLKEQFTYYKTLSVKNIPVKPAPGVKPRYLMKLIDVWTKADDVYLKKVLNEAKGKNVPTFGEVKKYLRQNYLENFGTESIDNLSISYNTKTNKFEFKIK